MQTNANTTAPATTAPAHVTPVALPAANVFAAPMGHSTATHVCLAGTVYAIAVPTPTPAGQAPAAPTLLPFVVPGAPGAAVTVVLGSTNNNWLGRNGAPLHVHMCPAAGLPGAGVTLQPRGSGGYTANAYTHGLHVAAPVMVVPAAPPAPAPAPAAPAAQAAQAAPAPSKAPQAGKAGKGS